MNMSLKFFSRVTLLATASLIAGKCIAAEDSGVDNATPYEHDGQKYPPILLVTNIEQPSLPQLLNKYQAFSEVNEEAVGLPIGVRVLKLHHTKNDTTQFSTLMLAASTLGIMPIVSNKQFKVRYDVFTQGEIVSTFTYEIESTDVSNLWSDPANKNKTKPEEELFIEESISRFLTELEDSSEIQELFQEYRDYYGAL